MRKNSPYDGDRAKTGQVDLYRLENELPDECKSYEQYIMQIRQVLRDDLVREELT